MFHVDGNRLWRASVRGDLDRQLDWNGRPIAYGYLDRRYPLADYQTVFGAHPGSAEMASAGRPFTDALVTRLVTAGVQLAPVTLHTGVSSQEAGEAPGPEWFEVSPTTARLVEAARAGGGRVIAVGTTATRAIESAVVDGAVTSSQGKGLVVPARGRAAFLLDSISGDLEAPVVHVVAEGGVVVAPRGVPHAFLVTSETARLLCLTVPGTGWAEVHYRDLSEPAGSDAVPGSRPPDFAKIRAVAERSNCIEILGPPPFAAARPPIPASA